MELPFCGLKNGFDMYGIDPEEWKHDFINRIDERKYPEEWKSRFFLKELEKNYRLKTIF